MTVPTTLPAPIWRRLIAAVYDGLLLLGVWMVAALVDIIVRDQLLGLPRHSAVLMAYFFLVGLAFCGWFWTHGGQTLGMRAWQLRTRRLDGQALRWPTAATRYAAMLLSWGITLTPLVFSNARLAAAHPGANLMTGLALSLIAAALVLCHLDPRRRLPQDWLSGSETVQEPKAG